MGGRASTLHPRRVEVFDSEKAWMINPRKTRTTRRRTRKKGKVTMARKRRQPAALAKYWAGKRKKTGTRKRRRSIVKRTVTRRRRRAVSYAANPRVKRRSRRSVSHRSHRRRSYRRNPGIGSLIPSTGFLKEIAFVGAGYYGTRVAYNFVGPMIGISGDLPRLAIKSAVAFGVAYLGGMLLGSGARNSLMLGGAVEVMHDAVKTYVSPFVPLLASADMQDVSAYFQPEGSNAEVSAYYQGVGADSMPGDNYAE